MPDVRVVKPCFLGGARRKVGDVIQGFEPKGDGVMPDCVAPINPPAEAKSASPAKAGR